MSDTYRIKQFGKEVFKSEGEHAIREVMLKARFYAQEGPLIIQRHNGRRWDRFGVVE